MPGLVLLFAAQLAYVAPNECPDQSAFWAEVCARSERAKTLDGELSFAVEVKQSGSAVLGQLIMSSTETSSTPNVREISGAACDEVVRALALIAALAIEAHEVEKVSVVKPVEETPEPRLVFRPVEGPPVLENRSRWRLSSGAGAGLLFGVMPSPALLLPAFVEYQNGTDVALRFGLLFAQAGGARGSTFTLIAGRGEVCPYAYEVGSFRAVPCVVAEAGALTGRQEFFASTLWLAGGAAGRVRFFGLDPFYAELEGSARIPFIRESFAFRPLTIIHQPDRIAADLALRAGVHFW
jgi:hypothetical protein